MSDRAAVPSWVIDGWYANNPEKQQLAIARYFMPVTTPEERELARQPNCNAHLSVFACLDCGKFAFSKPTLCYWCRRSEVLGPSGEQTALDVRVVEVQTALRGDESRARVLNAAGPARQDNEIRSNGLTAGRDHSATPAADDLFTLPLLAAGVGHDSRHATSPEFGMSKDAPDA